VIYQPFGGDHAARRLFEVTFTPPPIENVSGNDLAPFTGTAHPDSNTPQVTQDSPVKAERANYYDAGISQELAPGLQVGVDGYYKQARNQMDDGLFGQSLILSAFNYARGKVYGMEFTASYTHGGFSAYANVAWSRAQGEGLDLRAIPFRPGRPWRMCKTTGSISTMINASQDRSAHPIRGRKASAMPRAFMRTRSTAAVCGRTGCDSGSGNVIPNGGSVPSYYTINIGAEQSFKLDKKQMLKARLDVVNLTDNSYELRDGTGVGVNAAQYGARLGFFGSVSYIF
jgi:outer membrane receptor protein involved in Fe transport